MMKRILLLLAIVAAVSVQISSGAKPASEGIRVSLLVKGYFKTSYIARSRENYYYFFRVLFKMLNLDET